MERFQFTKNKKKKTIVNKYYLKDNPQHSYSVVYDAVGVKIQYHTEKAQRSFLNKAHTKDYNDRGVSLRGKVKKTKSTTKPRKPSGRSRGRPKGSKNKLVQAIIVEGKRKRKRNIKRF